MSYANRRLLAAVVLLAAFGAGFLALRDVAHRLGSKPAEAGSFVPAVSRGPAPGDLRGLVATTAGGESVVQAPTLDASAPATVSAEARSSGGVSTTNSGTSDHQRTRIRGEGSFDSTQSSGDAGATSGSAPAPSSSGGGGHGNLCLPSFDC